MASFFVVESGWLLDEAKRAALDAVDGYSHLNPYTIGIAVQAAAAILHTAAELEPGDGPRAVEAHERETEGVADADADAVALAVESFDVTPRLRALEGVAAAAQRLHRHRPAGAGADGCDLCAALVRLAALDEAG
jgi:hypothetical protein